MRRLLALTILLASSSAIGQSDFQTGAYVGVGLKHSSFEAKNYPPLVFDDSGAGPHIYGGFRFSDTFAFEAAHTRLTSLSMTDSGFTNLLGNYSATVTGDFDVTSVRLLAYTGRVMFGLGYFDAGITQHLTGVSQSFGSFSADLSDSDNGLTYLFGGEWPVKDWAIRAEFEWIHTQNVYEAWNFGVGAHYKWK